MLRCEPKTARRQWDNGRATAAHAARLATRKEPFPHPINRRGDVNEIAAAFGSEHKPEEAVQRLLSQRHAG